LFVRSKPRCVLLHSEKRALLPYETRRFLETFNATEAKNVHLQRNLAYLFAIQHGARFVLDWYLEDHDLESSNYTPAHITRPTYAIDCFNLIFSF